MFTTNNSLCSLNSQKLSEMEAFPIRMDLISVPVRTIPAVYLSRSSYSNFAFLFFMLMFFCIIAKGRYLNSLKQPLLIYDFFEVKPSAFLYFYKTKIIASMKYSLLLLIVFLFLSCNKNRDGNAQEIVDKAITKAGGDRYLNSKIEFDFRDKNYCALRNDNDFKLERQSYNDTLVTTDILTNSYFLRIENERQVALADSTKIKFSNSVNSVHYFSVLPFGLNDTAARKTLLGEVKIKGNTYYKIEVTFSEEDGGTDFDDVFLYWINTKTYLVDYLAYEFHVDGGGMRFREAYNERIVNGIRFVDYNNYKPIEPDVKLRDLDIAFEASKLELLSKIELENVKVEECISC